MSATNDNDEDLSFGDVLRRWQECNLGAGRARFEDFVVDFEVANNALTSPEELKCCRLYEYFHISP